jgi:hypothetical protein
MIDGLVRYDLYKVLDGVIYYKNRIYLVLGLVLKKNILESSHDSLLVGRPGLLNTLESSHGRASRVMY